jgi:beta-glucosidase
MKESMYYSGACTFLPGHSPPKMFDPLSWDDAYEEAAATLSKMDRDEKYLLLQGLGWHWPEGQEIGGGFWDLKKWYYVGNTAPIPRVGVPSLNMQDSSGGFRPYFQDMLGTVTGWPSSLALGATWDLEAVKLMALSLAQEVTQKGGNAILGPGVNVHRSQWGGRNFEYIGGEDPYLGSKLGVEYIRGMQSQGVMSVIKHWVFNEQETFRESGSSNVDKKTAWELYYPPFQAAVDDAGVVAAMCSYNKIDGVWSCENSDTLSDLKEVMGFRGFVQSDWWATHSTALDKGLDQDMPGIGDFGIGNMGNWSDLGSNATKQTWYSPSLLDEQPEDLIDASCLRILAAISKVRVRSNECSPPSCEEMLRRNVTSGVYSALARSIAASSVVLLMNSGGILPLTAGGVKTIAVVGSAAAAMPYDPNGKGQGEGEWWTGDIYSGGGSGHITMRPQDVVTPLAGITAAARAHGIGVVSYTGNSTSGAVAKAGEADVTIVVGGATTGESHDRETLHLQDDADELIYAVTNVSKKTVVLAQVPGAVVMPWREAVDAILIAFHPGQQAGNAWGDVVFGARAPAGRLPITLPATEDDTIRIDPDAQQIPYTEGLRTGYRSGMPAAFPFGHGLTYTTFVYERLETYPISGGDDLRISVRVRNVGSAAAPAVPQLYLEFGPEAEYPTPVLRGFQKTGVILPGGSEVASFSLTVRDLSYFDAGASEWVLCCNLTAHVGESSVDVRQSIDLSGAISEHMETPCGPPGSNWTVFITEGVLILLLTGVGVMYFRRKGACGAAETVVDGSSSDDDDSDSDEPGKNTA